MELHSNNSKNHHQLTASFHSLEAIHLTTILIMVIQAFTTKSHVIPVWYVRTFLGPDVFHYNIESDTP